MRTARRIRGPSRSCRRPRSACAASPKRHCDRANALIDSRSSASPPPGVGVGDLWLRQCSPHRARSPRPAARTRAGFPLRCSGVRRRTRCRRRHAVGSCRKIIEHQTQLGGECADARVAGVDQLAAEFADLAIGEMIAQAEHAPADALLRFVHAHARRRPGAGARRTSDPATPAPTITTSSLASVRCCDGKHAPSNNAAEATADCCRNRRRERSTRSSCSRSMTSSKGIPGRARSARSLQHAATHPPQNYEPRDSPRLTSSPLA